MKNISKFKLIVTASAVVTCLSLLSVPVYAAENVDENKVQRESFVLSQEEQNVVPVKVASELSNKDISTFVTNFFKDYYSNTYLERFEIDLGKYVDRSSGLNEYLKNKISIENKRNSLAGNITDFSVQVDVKDIFKNEMGYSAVAWITIDFKYPGCTDWSGMGRSATLEIVNSENGINIKSLCVNDDIDLIAIGDIDSFDCQKEAINWDSNEYIKQRLTFLSDYFNTENNPKIESIPVMLNPKNVQSAITSSNRSLIANYAINNCDQQSPAAGNASQNSYCDLSQFSGNYDCTNFASHCLMAGGASMTNDYYYPWYYYSLNNRTSSWSGVVPFFDFLINNSGIGPKGYVVGYAVNCPMSYINYSVGDIIQVDYNGYNNDALGYDHSTIVTGFLCVDSYYQFYSPKITSRSGYYSGLNTWYNKNIAIVQTGYANNLFSKRVVHLTNL